MRQHGERWLGILFGLTLMLGLMLGMTLTAHADGSASGAYLTFTGQEAFTLSTNNNRKIWNVIMEYSTDALHWTEWEGSAALSSSNTSPYVLYLRGSGNDEVGGEASNYFILNKPAACSGSIMALLDYARDLSSITSYNFSYLFYNCSNLTSAPELPATTLAYECYDSMFSGCTGLTKAPELPATTLAYECYQSMFSGCTGLTEAPELPATTLAYKCYKSMFSGCTGLTEAPKLQVTTLAYGCYDSMFYGCTGLTEAPELPATTLDQYCYLSMFYGCTGLTGAPELPATTLKQSCYQSMFSGCTGLTKAPELPAEIMVAFCYQSMFSGCTGLTGAPELPATTLRNFCYKSMFSGCTGLTKAPELRAATLASECYQSMFSGCTGLTRLPELPATTLQNFCYDSMFSGCTGIRVSAEEGVFDGVAYTIPFRIPGTGATDFSSGMLTGTGGRFTGDPQINTTYYMSVHTHDFTYSAGNATITATCGNTDCYLKDSKVTLTIDAPPHMTYGDGKEAAATLDGLEDFNSVTENRVALTDIRYAGREGTSYGESATAPTAAGKYTARITVEQKTASVDYGIAQATTIITENPEAGEITYGQTLSDSALTGGAANVEGSFAWKDSAVAPAVSDSRKTEFDVVFIPTDGNYTVAECGAKLTVNKADSAVTKAPKAKTLTYNGQAQALVDAGEVTGGTMQYALGTSTAATQPYTTSIPTKTDAGTCYVWYKVVGDDNHKDTDPAPLSVTISPADKATLNKAIAEAEAYYAGIKDKAAYAGIAAALNSAIEAATAVAANDNVTESAVAQAIKAVNDALDRAKADVAAIDKQAADEAAAKAVTDAINALPNPAGISDKPAVEAARAAYEALTDDQKALVPADAQKKLVAAEEQVRAAEEAAKTIDIAGCAITVVDRTYTGKPVKKPAVTVMDGEKKLVEDTDYTVVWNHKVKSIGAHGLLVRGIGSYAGERALTFRINPRGTRLTKLTAGRHSIILKWKKQAHITRYQIQIGQKEDFSDGKKLVIWKRNTLTRVIRKLEPGKTYYVRIRTYTRVKGRNYYSKWSEAQAVMTIGEEDNAAAQAVGGESLDLGEGVTLPGIDGMIVDGIDMDGEIELTLE